MGLIILSIWPVFTFLPIFMRERVGLNDGSIVFLSTGSLIGALISSYFWSWLVGRYGGSKPVSLTGLLLQGFWLGMPRGSSLSLLSGFGSILAECGKRIREFGRSRLEYPILAIVAMERSMK